MIYKNIDVRNTCLISSNIIGAKNNSQIARDRDFIFSNSARRRNIECDFLSNIFFAVVLRNRQLCLIFI